MDLPWWDLCPYKKRKRPEPPLFPPSHSEERHVWGGRLQAQRELSPNTKSVAPLSWTFQPPVLWEINVCCLSHPVYSTLLLQPELRYIYELFFVKDYNHHWLLSNLIPLPENNPVITFLYTLLGLFLCIFICLHSDLWACYLTSGPQFPHL